MDTVGATLRDGRGGFTGMVEIKCFRAIRGARLELAPVTMLTGRNNAGKSSVLEAVALAFSSPSLLDWLGNDIARMVIDDKLADHPARLLNSACGGEATISVKTGGQETRVIRIVRPGGTVVSWFLQMVLQRLRESFHEELAGRGEAYKCLRRSLARYTGESEALITILLATAYIVVVLAEQASKKRQSPLNVLGLLESMLREDPILASVLPETVRNVIAYTNRGKSVLASAASTLSNSISKIIEITTVDGVVIELDGISYLYLPQYRVSTAEEQYYEELEVLGAVFIRDLINIAGAILAEAELRDLYSIYTKLQLGRGLGGIARRCIWRNLRKTLDRLLTQHRVEVGQIRDEHGGWTVYTMFRRSMTIQHKVFGANTLVETVDAIHRLGLLEDYNNVVKRLGLKDPIIKNNEVYLIKDGERIPAVLLGDGTLQLLVLLAGLVLARGKPRTVLVLEEPETGLHPGYLLLLADNIVRAVREGSSTLILLSTHSEELIRFIAKRAEKHNVLDRVETILMHGGEVYSVFRGREILEAEEIGAELRGI